MRNFGLHQRDEPPISAVTMGFIFGMTTGLIIGFAIGMVVS